MMSNIRAEDHIALAFSIAQKYVDPSQKVEDTEEFADGLVGLTKAATAFDPNEGTEFSTLAYYCINNEIRNGLKRRKRQFIPLTTIATQTTEREDRTATVEPIDKRGSVDKIKAVQSFLIRILQPTELDTTKEAENKQLVRRHFLDGTSMQSLGVELGISREAVRQRVSRTLVKLKESHEHSYFDESILQMKQELN
tara:strand:+ start:1676 stop:2263 length:588 start_codon:yes stop_codon:yes gene_type:complete